MARTHPPKLATCLVAGISVFAIASSILWGAVAVFANRQMGAPPRPAGLAGYVKTDALDASLLLRSLAGMPDRQVLGYVLQAGRAESAFAILAFGDSLSDSERANALLTLAQVYAAANDTEKASICLGLLANLAVLGSDFHDYQKANLLLQAGDGLAALGRRPEAEDAYDRVLEIARFSPVLQASIRAQLLQSLATKYGALGVTSKSLEASQAAEQPAPSSVTEPVTIALPTAPVTWQDAPTWTALKSAEMARYQAVIELITAMESKAGGQTEAKRQAVAKALLAEDEAQDQFYNDQRPKAASVSARLALSQGRIAWLTLKWRVAARGFGISLVPDWENKLRDLEANLRRALEDHYTLHLELAALLPDPLAARQATMEALVDELKLSRLGLYPNAPERGLAGDLAAAIQERIALRDDGSLYVVAATRSGTTDIGFTFATADQLLRRQP